MWVKNLISTPPIYIFYYKVFIMDFVTLFKEDRLKRWMVTNQALENKDCDLNIGDKVVFISAIDPWEKIDSGTVGYISNKRHRYEGRPAEHYEYDVVLASSNPRCLTYDIIKYEDAADAVAPAK
jgi:hypothetical protein